MGYGGDWGIGGREPEFRLATPAIKGPVGEGRDIDWGQDRSVTL